MPPLKIDHIISFSSEDAVHVAKNLLGNSYSRKWKCARPGEKTATVCFQLEKPSVITGIDIGNEHSSYIEVLVSRSGEMNDDYKSFLVMSSFMSAIESRESTNINRVRMFKKDDFSKPECDEKWDRIKVVCSQPFNRHIQYGLSFVKFRSDTLDDKDDLVTDNSTNIDNKLGKFTLRPESPTDLGNGSLFARRREFESEENSKPLKGATSSKASTSRLSEDSNTSLSCSSLLPKGLKNCTPKKKVKVSLASNCKPWDETESLNPENQTSKIKMSTQNKNVETLRDTTKNSPQSGQKINKAEKESLKRKLPDDADKMSKKIKPSRKTKSFEKLLEDVVLVISGIQNPDRATLRGKILEMGAKYKPDWDNTCTHLVCAFMNTPKYNQVKGKGKIVTRQWIEECYTQRKKLPWRRYALDKQEKKKDESEDEIWEKLGEVRSQSPQEELNMEDLMYEDIIEQASDTEDIIEQIQKAPQTKNSPARTPTNNIDSNSSEPNPVPSPKKCTSSPIRKQKIPSEPSPRCSKKKQDHYPEVLHETSRIKEDINAYSAETDTEEEMMQCPVTNQLFDIFSNKVFFIDSNFEKSIGKMLKNYIFMHEGSLVQDTSGNIDYIICGKDEAANYSPANPRAICVLPDWVIDCHKHRKFIPPDEYFVL